MDNGELENQSGLEESGQVLSKPTVPVVPTV